jgi:hypothetical protein
MTIMKAIRLASLITAINVLVASGFAIGAIIRPQCLVSAESIPTEASLLLAMYAATRTIPLALFALGAIYKQATPALLILGALAARCNCWMPESVCLSMILGNALGRSLSPSPILRGVSASQICADHAANQPRINARYDAALPSSPQLRR